MKNLFFLLAAAALLSGCVYNSKMSTNGESLAHHRFVLESVNGKAVSSHSAPLELSFGERQPILERIYISGSMCNGFSGTATLHKGELKATDLAVTRKLCSDPQLNSLDGTLSTMLRQGAQVDLTEQQLTLATADQTLIYRLADLVH
ncbi:MULTISPECIES: heat shock protein HslJ [Enterobacteriaceae]|uniref:heat shock protein HslJ n=1 Tax=Enterobacteriaceae TaxID=543 RepID=UPI0015DBE74A|nr:heat shock protein HslJ [Klebsiella sp. WP8-S18-ESBL-06]BBT70681.1 heat-shock protein HslJ [Klebsiella sp. WP8-S18-ESBL-06]